MDTNLAATEEQEKSNINRRDIVKAGAIALSAGGSLLPSIVHSAPTVYEISNLKLLTATTKLFRAKDGLDYNCYSYSYTRAGKTEHAVWFFRSSSSGFGCRTYFNSSGVKKHAHYNSLRLYSSSGKTYIAVENKVHEINHSEVIDGHITYRNLTSTQWMLPAGSAIQDEYYSLVDAGANQIDYVTYLYNSVNYVKAEIYAYFSALGDHTWITTLPLRGADYNKFFELFNKWRAATVGATSRSPYYKNGRWTVAIAWGVGVALSGFTGGASLAAVGAWTVTAAGAGVALTVAQQTDMIAVQEAYANLQAFVFSKTSESLP